VKKEIGYRQTITNGEVGKQMKKTGSGEPSRLAILNPDYARNSCCDRRYGRFFGEALRLCGKADTSASIGLSCFPDELHLEGYKPSRQAA
jgi:hypothetical protein